MKTRTKLAAALITAGMALNAQTQIVRWVNTIGGNNSATPLAQFDAIKGIAEDGYSNTYVIGNFKGSFPVTVYAANATNGLATGAGAPVTITSAGGQDVFLARYDRDGNCTWATSIGGPGFDEGNAICFNGSPTAPSEFYITGKFDNSMNIQGNTLNSMWGFSDAFVIKYSAGLSVTPSALWWRNLGGGAETNGLAIAASGTNVYITGYFTEWVDNPDTYNPQLQKTKINGATSGFSTPTPGYLEFPARDMFVARFTNAGAFSDALNTYRSDEQIEGRGIAVRGSDLFITGTYKGSIKLNSSTSALTCSGHSDIFVAKYPAAFSTSTGMILATSAVTAGGTGTFYQAAPEQIPYRPDGANGISVTNQGVFVTGRFMNSASFGSSFVDPQPSDVGVTYMFLARYDHALSNSPALYTGTENHSEGNAIYGLSGTFAGGYVSTIFVTGIAQSHSKINGTQVRNNSFPAEYTGFVTRIAYNPSINNFDAANVNNFTDGITQNLGGLDGTGGAGLDFNVNVRGYAVSYRVGCGVRVAGAFNAKTYFGNRLKNVSGANDGFLMVRENTGTVMSNQISCGSGAVTINGTGTGPYEWTNLSGTVLGTGNSLAVTPVANSFTTVVFTSTNSGTCPPSVSPVTLFNYPSSTVVNAGPNKTICLNLGQTSAVIGTAPITGATYLWSPATGLSSPIIAMPTASPATSTTYVLTMTDKCGVSNTDAVVVGLSNSCPRVKQTVDPSVDPSARIISVYPNPTNGKFTLATETEDAKTVIVFDYTGKIVFQKNNITDASLNIDITNEAKGIYFIKVVIGDIVKTAKLINQ